MSRTINHLKRTCIGKPTGQCKKKIRHELPVVSFDINAPNKDGLTPLHQAVLYNNTVMLSKLLYYGADVTRVDRRNFTPFLLAVVVCNLQAVILLFTYYEHFSPRFIYVHYMNILDLRNIQNELIIDNRKFLEFIFLIWEKLNQHLTDIDRRCFWLNYITECNSINHMLRGNCFFILEFALPFYLPHHRFQYKFSELFERCEQRLILPKHRMNLTWLWLSLGIEVFLDDVKTAFRLYGHDREVHALLSTMESPLLTFILALEGNDNEEMFKNYLSSGFGSKTYNVNFMFRKTVELIELLLDYFSLPWKMKKVLLRRCRRFASDNTKVMEKAMKLPEIPLLTELSRNQSVQFLKDNFRMTKVEEYKAVVRRLNIDEEIKNIILFEKPLYV